MRVAYPWIAAGVVVAACSTQATPRASSGTTSSSASSTSTTSSSGGTDAGPDAPVTTAFCSLPGSVRFTASGTMTVPGGSPSWASLAFLHLPPGFCAHYFGTIGNARQIRFAPGGDLFVASPTMGTTGGGQGGQSAIVVLPDRNGDGVADGPVTFMSFPVGSTNQGLLFAKGSFYYQDGTPPGTKIMRVPYAPGDLTPSGASEVVADITIFVSPGHWPKTMDVADDGTIYVGNGANQGDSCISPHVFQGGILAIDPAPGGPNPGGTPIAMGFRNPINVRCARGHNRCFALELALDYSSNNGGREKMVPIRKGDDWGFPCCATKDLPYPGAAFTDCSQVSAETNSFVIGDTPFGVDFEGGKWPAPWTGRAYVVTHGTAGSWNGARMVAIPMDPTTGLPQPSSNTSGSDVGMVDFATGWDDNSLAHGRPAAVTFAPDGRLFVANDNDGTIFWIAPLE